MIRVKLFYVYKSFFDRVGLRLPFTEFKCVVMRMLDNPPYQLHPTCWNLLDVWVSMCTLESVLHSDIKLLPLPTEDRQPGCYFFNEWSTNRSLYKLFESIFPKVACITGIVYYFAMLRVSQNFPLIRTQIQWVWNLKGVMRSFWVISSNVNVILLDWRSTSVSVIESSMNFPN